MSSSIPTVSGITEVKEFIEQALLDTSGAILVKVEQPLQRLAVEAGALKCTKCSHETLDRSLFIHHLVECHDGSIALTRFTRYNLYSKHIELLQAEAHALQLKHILVPIKGETRQILKVTYGSSLAHLFAAGAVLKTTPEGAFTVQLELNSAKSTQSCELYIEMNALYRNTCLVSNIKEIAH